MTDPSATSPLALKNPDGRDESAARTAKMARGTNCPTFVTGDGKTLAVKRPMKAIRAKCIDCTCGQLAEIRRCQITDCPLFPYRMGRRPRPEDLVAGSDTA